LDQFIVGLLFLDINIVLFSIKYKNVIKLL
jgi:hypothetical protein